MKNNFTKEQLRTRALELYNSNWSVTEICKTLNCSRKWFYKWLNRSQSNPDKSGQWFIERSRRPKTKKKKIDYNTEQLVLETRKKLISTPFMQFGPQAIYYDIKMRNLTPPPVWSIARILQQNQLTDKKRTGAYKPKGKKYPYDGYILSQQMDFVGPRYLSSKTRFYFLNIICCDTHYAQVVVLENQTSNNVCNNLISFWKTAGIPDFLQMDNDLSFWGSLIRPTALGKIIRLCLLHRVTPVFIPVREPWRNGIIEHFNNTMQGAVLNSGKFENIGQVQQAAEHFCQIHNQSHHYSCLDGLTPEQYRKKFNYPTVALPEDYTLPNKTLPLEGGEIHIIRFIRSDLKFNIFNLSFILPEETQYEYVKGVIITHEHKLKIFKEQKYITEFQFRLY
jgi:putative transposase